MYAITFGSMTRLTVRLRPETVRLPLYGLSGSGRGRCARAAVLCDGSELLAIALAYSCGQEGFLEPRGGVLGATLLAIYEHLALAGLAVLVVDVLQELVEEVAQAPYKGQRRCLAEAAQGHLHYVVAPLLHDVDVLG